MRKSLIPTTTLCVLLCVLPIAPVTENRSNFAIIDPDDSIGDIISKAANITPLPRQYDWQRLEFTAFTHFTINTFTDKEWGDGTEDPALFNPTDFDARQWIEAIKNAGMKQVIMTCKHHDGFCLWPSKLTDHSVKSSPWRNGRGDVVGEVAEACREAGLKFGVYLSPWDRHERTYGDSPVYNEFFKNQLRELLTWYGSIAEVWFDGACGEGPNGKRQVYDWQGYYSVIRELQPEAVIAIMGPDVRWVGTESGYGRETEWSIVPVDIADTERTAAASQKKDIGQAFVPKDLMEKDLGSREKIADASMLVWYPSEVDVSIRPGWFYHRDQDDKVKSPEKLVDIFFSSVGRNSLLLLNIPPDTRGRIHENDIESLRGMRRILDETFGTNFAAGAKGTASSALNGHAPSLVTDDTPDTYWMAEGNTAPVTLELDLGGIKKFDVVMLMENILTGQRVERFIVKAHTGGAWKEITGGTTIGYKRLLRFPEVTADKVRIRITESRAVPTLSSFGLYDCPIEFSTPDEH